MEGETMYTRVFTIPDYVVLVVAILISVGIGIFYAVKDRWNNTSSNYFLGNRQLKAVPLGLSYVVTFQSAIMILGTPAEVYVYGMQYVVVLIGAFIGIFLSALIVVPLFHPLNITSVYEYYNLRYGTNDLRYLGVLLGITYYILYMGIVLFGTALALESTTGLPLWGSIVMFSSAAVIYTSIGGIKAVIWTDVFQTIVMFCGILAVLIKSTISAGGPTKIIQLSKDRFNFFNFNPDPTIRHTFWTLILGAAPQYFYMTITQAGVQRIISTPNVKTARRLLFIASPIYCLMWALVMFEGVTVFAYFSDKGCDPLASGEIINPNQIIPFTILEMFHNMHGMPGLFIAALAAASLSTISSGLSSLAAVLCVDVLNVCKPRIKDQTATNISRCFVVLLGVISAAIAFLLSNMEGPLSQVMAGLSGAVAGPETGMFLVSAFFRRSQPRAVFFATLFGLAFNLWLNFGQTFSKDITTPYLPLGPVEHCTDSNDTSLYNAESMNNASDLYLLGTTSTSTPTVSNLTVLNNGIETTNNQLSGLNTFYSVSYMYFHLIGTVVTVLVAIFGSLITQPKQKIQVNEKCLLTLKMFCPTTFFTNYGSQSHRQKEKNDENMCEAEKMIAENHKDSYI